MLTKPDELIKLEQQYLDEFDKLAALVNNFTTLIHLGIDSTLQHTTETPDITEQVSRMDWISHNLYLGHIEDILTKARGELERLFDSQWAFAGFSMPKTIGPAFAPHEREEEHIESSAGTAEIALVSPDAPIHEDNRIIAECVRTVDANQKPVDTWLEDGVCYVDVLQSAQNLGIGVNDISDSKEMLEHNILLFGGKYAQNNEGKIVLVLGASELLVFLKRSAVNTDLGRVRRVQTQDTYEFDCTHLDIETPIAEEPEPAPESELEPMLVRKDNTELQIRYFTEPGDDIPLYVCPRALIGALAERYVDAVRMMNQLVLMLVEVTVDGVRLLDTENTRLPYPAIPFDSVTDAITTIRYQSSLELKEPTFELRKWLILADISAPSVSGSTQEAYADEGFEAYSYEPLLKLLSHVHSNTNKGFMSGKGRADMVLMFTIAQMPEEFVVHHPPVGDEDTYIVSINTDFEHREDKSLFTHISRIWGKHMLAQDLEPINAAGFPRWRNHINHAKTRLIGQGFVLKSRDPEIKRRGLSGTSMCYLPLGAYLAIVDTYRNFGGKYIVQAGLGAIQ